MDENIMKFDTVYIIEYLPTGKYIAKQSCTYAVRADQSNQPPPIVVGRRAMVCRDSGEGKGVLFGVARSSGPCKCPDALEG
jgi:hypothetical protein